jgi:hypothetical protein
MRTRVTSRPACRVRRCPPQDARPETRNRNALRTTAFLSRPMRQRRMRNEERRPRGGTIEILPPLRWSFRLRPPRHDTSAGLHRTRSTRTVAAVFIVGFVAIEAVYGDVSKLPDIRPRPSRQRTIRTPTRPSRRSRSPIPEALARPRGATSSPRQSKRSARRPRVRSRIGCAMPPNASGGAGAGGGGAATGPWRSQEPRRWPTGRRWKMGGRPRLQREAKGAGAQADGTELCRTSSMACRSSASP